MFIPTQKHTDISLKDSKISMFECITKTAELCNKSNISLVIKIHPHLKTKKKLYGPQINLIRNLQKKIP